MCWGGHTSLNQEKNPVLCTPALGPGALVSRRTILMPNRWPPSNNVIHPQFHNCHQNLQISYDVPLEVHLEGVVGHDVAHVAVHAQHHHNCRELGFK